MCGSIDSITISIFHIRLKGLQPRVSTQEEPMAHKFPPIDSRNFSTGSQLDSAIFFAENQVPVVPLYGTKNGQCNCTKGSQCRSPGKHPMTKHGFKDASAEIDQIEDWWMEAPGANLGLLTGNTTGIVVLDVDPRHGGDQSCQALQEEFGPLPRTLRVKTGGGGEHYYFQHPGREIRNIADIRPGLDIRGDGGYIVAPPSVHASQNPYKWDGETAQVAPLPRWLFTLLTEQKKNKNSPQSTRDRGSMNEGSRNTSLLSIGGTLVAKGLPIEQIASSLESLNQTLCKPPLESKEVQSIVASLSKYQEIPWEEPRKLPEAAKALSLDPALLPKPLSAWCSDIAERMQVPLECVAGPAIVMFASLIGRKVVIRPKRKDKWEKAPNLWGMIVSPPGTLKTPTLNAVLKPIHDLDNRAQTESDAAREKFNELEFVAKTEIDALKDSLKKAVKEGKLENIEECKNRLQLAVRKLENSKITEKRYIANDPTTEKLLTIIADNPQGILLYRDELSGWLETMQKSGREGDRQFFLESWNGDSPYKMDRISRGTISVEGLCLSVLGGLQPVVFDNYVSSVVKGGKSDDGLLQRFQILIYPERRKGWKRIDREPDEKAEEVICSIVKAIDAIPVPKRTNDGIERYQLGYSEDAQKIADDWVEALEHRLESDSISPIYEAHLGKYRSLMPSLAVVFSLINEISLDENSIPQEVDVQSVQLAISWCSFLESHAKKGYGEHLDPKKSAARHLLAKIHKKQVKDFERPRDLYRKKWKGLASADDLESALNILAKLGWLRIEVINSEGKSIEVIRLHPSLRAN